MNVAAQLKTMIDFLDENEQLLVFEIVKRFIPDGEVMPYDSHYIDLGEQELASGNIGKWSDIDWK